MIETFEGRTLRLIHEAKEEIRKLPEHDPKVQELNNKVKDLIGQLLKWNKEHLLSNK
jgi:hypothetical protein